MTSVESSETLKRANALAQIIRIVGVLFYLAMAFGLMRWQYAIFAGTACMVVAPVVRQLILSRN